MSGGPGWLVSFQHGGQETKSFVVGALERIGFLNGKLKKTKPFAVGALDRVALLALYF